MSEFRVEEDLLGTLEIPANSYWGIHTERAKKNFSISGYRVNPFLIKALALVKKACALTNLELGYLEEKKAKAIITACDEIIQGHLLDQFHVDALQGGAGTSTNMNINEVIANRAIELLGGKKGDYSIVHPIEDVNLHQSTNDTYPTAVKIACIYRLKDLSQAIATLQGAFQKKEKEFAGIVKIGRTELQEAVPITLGAEFSAFAEAIARDRWRTFKCEERLRVVNIGGTAVGTGLTAPRDYIFLVIEKLREVTGLGLARGENLMGETANVDPFIEVSGIMKAHASNLIKISNDLRLLNLLEEIKLPPLQSGSSIMPGKVNPVMLEAVIQVALKVIANDFLITEAASRSTFQICEFLPLLAHAILESMDLLVNINLALAEHVKSIKACEKRCKEYVDKSITIITAFLPVIGYERAEKLVKKFLTTGKTNFKEFLKEELERKMVEEILSPYKLTALGNK
ncbi:MAG: Aspartate ammonia-lyase [Thermodesulfobacterium sp.]|uniref:Aspartate ammonia-lyase n=1 Tax=Candidatus Thermodesulfobacterium syntrophicum TaxID=3060442 RepID=A0AAE3P5G8_9BACT|nr:Aspartate ammonia-lyase [Candidatus Thermodesulfobacterium syntrophicum]